jgi:Ca2+-binding RTX toxin-like protein
MIPPFTPIIPTLPNFIQNLDGRTIPFETRFVRNVIDSDITLPASFTSMFDETTTLNGRTLTITGLQFGDAIRFDPASGFVVGFPNTTLNGNPIATTGGSSGSSFSLTFTTSFSPAQLEQLLEAMTFQAGPTSAPAASRTLTLSVNTSTPLTGTVSITLQGPAEQNQIQGMDNQTVPFSSAPVALDSAIELSDAFRTAYSAPGSLFNREMAVTGWTGQQAPIGVLEGSGVVMTQNPNISFFRDFSVDGIAMGSMNLTIGTIYFSAGATAALVERLIEGLTINPQLSVQTTSRTITVTILTPTAPQHGTVTFTGVPIAFSDLRESVEVDLAPISTVGLVLDSDVTIVGDTSWNGGQIEVTGLRVGDRILIQPEESSGMPGEILIGDTGEVLVMGQDFNIYSIGMLGTSASGFTVDLNSAAQRADVERIIESLRLYAVSEGERTLEISVSDSNGFVASDTITVNVRPEGASALNFQILQNVNGVLVPVENGSGIAGDLNPATLFGTTTIPDSFVVEYSGLLNVAQPIFGERSVIGYENVPPGSELIVNGVSYPFEGQEGVLTLYLEPGLHKITLRVSHEAAGGELVTTLPRLTFGNAFIAQDGNPAPGSELTPLFDSVRTTPDTLFKLTVLTTMTFATSETVFSNTVYLTENSPAAIDAAMLSIRMWLNPPPNFGVSQTYTTVLERVGGDGSEVMAGAETDDFLSAGAGDDTLLGSLGADTLDGGTGENTVSYAASDRRVTVDLAKGVGQGGHAEGDVLRDIQNVIGSGSRDHIIGSSGDNRLFGGRGHDTMSGGAGDDLLNGGGENDVLDGGTGNDTLIGGNGNDIVTGGAGNDLILGDHGNDNLIGGAGNDTLRGGTGADTIDGGEGHNWARYGTSTAGVNVSLTTGTGSAGDALGDVLINISALAGSAHADTLEGSGGADTLDGGTGNDVLEGQDGNDLLIGGAGDDSLMGGAGNDQLQGWGGADYLDGGAGINTLSYRNSNAGVMIDLAEGTASGGHAEGDQFKNIQSVIGSSHGDQLVGSSANETLAGGGGNDSIVGAGGNDVLTGGAGSDMFLFDLGSGSDRIRDFSAEDEIGLSGQLWGGVTVNDGAALVEAFGHQVGSYVELRFTETDVLRIDNMTLATLSQSTFFLWD